MFTKFWKSSSEQNDSILTSSDRINSGHQESSPSQSKTNFFKNLLLSPQIDPYPLTQRIALPENFAQRVIQLEMSVQLVENFTLDVVKQLNELYRLAIQYYAASQDVDDKKKAEQFKRKLTKLLANPMTLELMEHFMEHTKMKTDEYGLVDSKQKRNSNTSTPGKNSNCQGKDSNSGSRKNSLKNNSNDKSVGQYQPQQPIETQSDDNPYNLPAMRPNRLQQYTYTAKLNNQLNRVSGNGKEIIQNMINGREKSHDRCLRIVEDKLNSQEDKIRRRIEARSANKGIKK